MSLGVPGITFKTIFPTYVVGSKLGNCPSQKLADDAMTPQTKDEQKSTNRTLIEIGL